MQVAGDGERARAWVLPGKGLRTLLLEAARHARAYIARHRAF